MINYETMKTSTNKRKSALWIAIIVAVAIALAAAVFFVFYLKPPMDSPDRIKKEQARFDKVLDEAPDEELLIVLKYGIVHHYVPTRDIDPYFDVRSGVSRWHRTLRVYEKLSHREDLLQEIYPDVQVLGDYVRRNEYVRPFEDTIAAQTIIRNAQTDKGRDVDSLMETHSRRRPSLKQKYYGTPLLRY